MWESISRLVALVVTNTIKVAGLYVGVRAGIRAPVDAVAMAWSAFAMAGAQLSETTILRLVERFFGQGSVEDRK